SLEPACMGADSARRTELVGAAQPTDAGRLRALADWYGRYEAAIHDHHHAEEAVIYPALLERDPSFADAERTPEGAVIYPALLERDPSFAEADGQLEGASTKCSPTASRWPGRA